MSTFSSCRRKYDDKGRNLIEKIWLYQLLKDLEEWVQKKKTIVNCFLYNNHATYGSPKTWLCSKYQTILSDMKDETLYWLPSFQITFFQMIFSNHNERNFFWGRRSFLKRGQWDLFWRSLELLYVGRFQSFIIVVRRQRLRHHYQGRRKVLVMWRRCWCAKI